MPATHFDYPVYTPQSGVMTEQIRTRYIESADQRMKEIIETNLP